MKKEMRIIGSTENCIVCLDKATNWSGHVVKGNESVLAGFCKLHRASLNVYLLGRGGCFGGWHKLYGPKKDRELLKG